MEESLTGELIALAFNSGIVLAFVQLLKVVIIPKLRLSVPWSIPMIAASIGLLSSVIMKETGIDISPIASTTATSSFSAH